LGVLFSFCGGLHSFPSSSEQVSQIYGGLFCYYQSLVFFMTAKALQSPATAAQLFSLDPAAIPHKSHA
jgi:hypothetical protein